MVGEVLAPAMVIEARRRIRPLPWSTREDCILRVPGGVAAAAAVDVVIEAGLPLRCTLNWCRCRYDRRGDAAPLPLTVRDQTYLLIGSNHTYSVLVMGMRREGQTTFSDISNIVNTAPQRVPSEGKEELKRKERSKKQREYRPRRKAEEKLSKERILSKAKDSCNPTVGSVVSSTPTLGIFSTGQRQSPYGSGYSVIL